MLEELAKNYLLAVAKAYAKAAGCSLAAVSKKFYGNQAFLGRLARSDASMTFSKHARVLAKLSAEWPDGAEWPEPVAVLLRRPE